MTLKFASFMSLVGLLVCPIVATAQSDMSVALNVTLSEIAASRLAADKESIVALASYSAEPKKNAVALANKVNAIGPDGMVNLTPSQESVEIAGKGALHALVARILMHGVSLGLQGHCTSISMSCRQENQIQTIFLLVILSMEL